MDNTENVDRVGQLLSDHRALLSCICGLRDWTREVSEWGMPRFGELGSRLAPFREILAHHFADEESAKYFQIVPVPGTLSLSDQHHRILERLDGMIISLRAPEPEFGSWQIAVQQVETLIAEICDHEEHESGVLQSSKSEASATKTSTA